MAVRLDLKLQDLLRYAFSRAAGLVTLVLTYPKVTAYPLALRFLPGAGGTGEAVLAIGVVLVIGSLTYAVHRAVLYPLLFSWLTVVPLSFFHTYDFQWKLLVPWAVSHVELEHTRWHWKARKDGHFAYPHLTEWGAMNHLLYCSGWSILMAAKLGAFVPVVGQPHPAASHFFVGLACAFLGVAHISNVRLVYTMKRMYTV